MRSDPRVRGGPAYRPREWGRTCQCPAARLTRYEAARAARSGTLFPTTFLLAPRLHNYRQEIRDDQRDGIVIAAEQCEQAPPRARRPEVRGEFTIDFRRALLSLDLRQVWLPIDNSPGGERRHHLLALLERHLEPRAVAPCMDADISAAIDLQQVLAADMPQERPVHLELARTGPHCLQHRRQIQVSHSASSSNRAATKRPIHRAGRSCSSHRRGDLCREGWTVSRQADPGA